MAIVWGGFSDGVLGVGAEEIMSTLNEKYIGKALRAYPMAVVICGSITKLVNEASNFIPAVLYREASNFIPAVPLHPAIIPPTLY